MLSCCAFLVSGAHPLRVLLMHTAAASAQARRRVLGIELCVRSAACTAILLICKDDAVVPSVFCCLTGVFGCVQPLQSGVHGQGKGLSVAHCVSRKLADHDTGGADWFRASSGVL
jgi:hypothetical protein